MSKGCLCHVEHDAECVAEVSHDEVRTARKSYACCECRGLIQVGDRYEYSTGLYDGAWQTFRTCLTCKNARDSLMCGWTYGEVWADIAECLGMTREECV